MKESYFFGVILYFFIKLKNLRGLHLVLTLRGCQKQEMINNKFFFVCVPKKYFLRNKKSRKELFMFQMLLFCFCSKKNCFYTWIPNTNLLFLFQKNMFQKNKFYNRYQTAPMFLLIRSKSSSSFPSRQWWKFLAPLDQGLLLDCYILQYFHH